MKNLSFASLFLLITGSIVFAQSGRRVAPAPAPSPMEKKADAADYSESKPSPHRSARVTERFPGIGNGSNPKTGTPNVTTTTPADAKEDNGDVLRIETNLITIPVSVFDRNGLYIPGLRQNEFKIFEDGVEQEIAYFGTTDKPFTVVLLIDVSPSTAYKIEEIQQAAMAFVNNLEARDSVIVMDFDSSVKVLTEATNDRERIYKAIRKTGFGSGTSLYNAVDEALRKQLSRISGRKAVVLFTDGVDTTSFKHSYESTVDYAEESDSLIFPIYYNTFFDSQGGLGNINGGIIPTINRGGYTPIGGSREDYARGRTYLEELAAVTGGRVFRPESTPGGLTSAFEGIAEELRRQYSIGYVPKDEGAPGQRKQIKVRVDRPNLVLRARDSYIVGAKSQAATTSPAKSN